MRKMDFVFPRIKPKYLPILLLTAFRAEAEVLLRIHPFQLIGQEKNFHLYQLQPESIYLLISGPGNDLPYPSLEKWIKQTAPALIINFGICGGLDPTLRLFQNYLVRQVAYLTESEISTEIPFPKLSEKLLDLFPNCRLLTSDSPVLQESLRKQLHWQSGCQLLDMEAYFFASVSRKYSIPIIILKQLTDYCDEKANQIIRENRSIWQNYLGKGLHQLLEALSEIG
jgi:nucleoside phosphorylase